MKRFISIPRSLRSVVLLVVVVVAFMSMGRCVVEATSANEGDGAATSTRLRQAHVPNEYCCCSTETVDEHTKPTLEVLDRVVQRPYFRYFKVNTEKKCAYWAVSLLCTGANNPCKVCHCDANDMPFGLKEELDMGCPNPAAASSGHESRDGTVSRGVAAGLANGLWSGFEEDAHLQQDDGAQYVDLVANPEGYTGYSGEMANRIWREIYSENCFAAVPGDEQCSEQRIFYDLISGLHASISTHLSVRYHKDSSGDCSANCDELRRRVTDHGDRVDNVYTLYLFLLRALTKAKDIYLDDTAIYAMDQGGTDDSELKQLLGELFHNKLLCSNTFNDTKVLESAEGRRLIPEMKRMLRNITTLMDCLTCEKCRVWGKVQTMGMATALKLITADPDQPLPSLSRAEKVTLMNFVRQVSFSVNSLRTECHPPMEPEHIAPCPSTLDEPPQQQDGFEVEVELPPLEEPAASTIPSDGDL